MPYIRVRIATSATVSSQAVATMLTELAVSRLGKLAAAAAVDVRFSAPDDWFIGGVALSVRQQSSFFVEIKLTQDTNTRDQKAAFVKAAYDGLAAMLPAVAETSYVVLQDVASDSWGYGGRTQEARYIAG